MDGKVVVTDIDQGDVLLIVPGGEIQSHDFTVILIIDSCGSYVEGVVGVGLEAGNGNFALSVLALKDCSVHEKDILGLLSLRRTCKSRIGDLSDAVCLYGKGSTVGAGGYKSDFQGRFCGVVFSFFTLVINDGSFLFLFRGLARIQPQSCESNKKPCKKN